jgi:hypothetical protein
MAMPMLVVTKMSRPLSTFIGSRKSDWTRSATNRRRPAVDAVEENRELVAAQTRQHVAGAQARGELVRDGREQLIANEVAEAVVHQLEAIDVDEEHRVAVVAHALRAREHAPSSCMKAERLEGWSASRDAPRVRAAPAPRDGR